MKIVVQMQIKQTWCDLEPVKEADPRDLDGSPHKDVRLVPEHHMSSLLSCSKYSPCNSITTTLISRWRTECG